MGKRGLMFALSLVLMLIIIASLGALYFVSEESLTKYIILGFMALFVFLLVLDTIIHFSSKAYKLRKKLSSINIKEGDLDDLKCAIKTYLFGIGKYMLFVKARKNNKNVADFPLENEDYNYQEISTAFISDSINDRQLLLQKALITLGKKCKEVLTLFYYRGFTIDEIATHLNYENKNVVKSQKSRCIKQLKEKINN